MKLKLCTQWILTLPLRESRLFFKIIYLGQNHSNILSMSLCHRLGLTEKLVWRFIFHLWKYAHQGKFTHEASSTHEVTKKFSMTKWRSLSNLQVFLSQCSNGFSPLPQDKMLHRCQLGGRGLHMQWCSRVALPVRRCAQVTWRDWKPCRPQVAVHWVHGPTRQCRAQPSVEQFFKELGLNTNTRQQSALRPLAFGHIAMS